MADGGLLGGSRAEEGQRSERPLEEFIRRKEYGISDHQRNKQKESALNKKKKGAYPGTSRQRVGTMPR